MGLAPGYSFTEGAIKVSAPSSPGVYIIYNRAVFIYVGEAINIRKRLREHIKSDKEGILQYDPVYFDYEMCPGNRRVERQREVVRRLKPVCNLISEFAADR